MVCCVHVGVIVCFTHHFRRENHSMISIYSKKRAKFLWLPHGGIGSLTNPHNKSRRYRVAALGRACNEKRFF